MKKITLPLLAALLLAGCTSACDRTSDIQCNAIVDSGFVVLGTAIGVAAIRGAVEHAVPRGQHMVFSMTEFTLDDGRVVKGGVATTVLPAEQVRGNVRLSCVNGRERYCRVIGKNASMSVTVLTASENELKEAGIEFIDGMPPGLYHTPTQGEPH